MHFLETSLRPMLTEQSVVILDNARIHHTAESRILMEQVFEEKYYFTPPYSPHLKPVEACFALIKEWIRKREEAALLAPVEYINRAFELHSIGQEKAPSILGHWQMYFNNHEMFLNMLR